MYMYTQSKIIEIMGVSVYRVGYVYEYRFTTSRKRRSQGHQGNCIKGQTKRSQKGGLGVKESQSRRAPVQYPPRKGLVALSDGAWDDGRDRDA